MRPGSREWTADDDALLRKFYEDHSYGGRVYKAAAQALDRTEGAVTARAWRLGCGTGYHNGRKFVPADLNGVAISAVFLARPTKVLAHCIVCGKGRPVQLALLRRAPRDGRDRRRCADCARNKWAISAGINRDGYRWWQWLAPDGKTRVAKAEHAIVMEGMIGRELLPGENVHHKNGVRDDNRPENLELWVVSQPRGQRPEDLVDWAQEILRRYAA